MQLRVMINVALPIGKFMALVATKIAMPCHIAWDKINQGVSWLQASLRHTYTMQDAN